jgi:hypothetical protein
LIEISILYLQVMKITRFACLFVIFPILFLAFLIYFDLIKFYGVSLFSIIYCGVLIPGLKIIENPQLRKFAISCFKDFFNRLKSWDFD